MAKEKFDLKEIKNTKWQSTFQREIPLIEVCEWAQAYTKDMEKTVGWKFSKVLFVSEKGIEQSFRHTDDFLSLHKFLKDKLKKDNNFLFKIGQKINKYLENWLKICDFINNSNLKKLTNKKLLEIYQVFNKRQRLFFSIIQFPVDAENSKVAKKLEHLKQLQEIAKIRDYAAKKMYEIREQERHKLFSVIANRIKTNYNLFYFLLSSEVQKSLQKNKLVVDRKILSDRYNLYIFLAYQGKMNLFIGRQALEIRDKEFGYTDFGNINDLKGKIANIGKAKGIVKVIFKKSDLKKIQRGDIFVSYMTIPDHVICLRKVKAIITDEGGITCHAAIVSRELNKPCIIGTKIATQVLKDGDLVEVDAEKGVVKILKRA